jgi:hypothetical protein
MTNIRYQIYNYSLENENPNHQHTEKKKLSNKRQNKWIKMHQERESVCVCVKKNTLDLSINGFFLVFCEKFLFT